MSLLWHQGFVHCAVSRLDGCGFGNVARGSGCGQSRMVSWADDDVIGSVRETGLHKR